MKSVLERENELDPERLFFNSIKSKATKHVYTIYLQKFIKFVNCKTINGLVYDFKGSDSKDIERRLIEFIIQLKENGMNYQSIQNYVAPVISFYKINDVMLNSKKISRFMPAKTRVRKNRGYEHDEIQKLLDIADERMRAVILLLVSSGCRIGSVCTLHVRDLEKIGDVYKVTIYENQEEEYFSFTTPEFARAIESYFDMRRRYGEQVGPDSILIREQFDIRDPFAAAHPRPVSTITLKGKLMQLAERAGLREKVPLKVGEKGASIRKPVPISHGFRKAFATFAENSKMNIIQRRMLQGHSVGIDEHYVKPSESDLLEQYQMAIDALTIDPSNRLQRKVEKLEIEKSEIQDLRLELEKVKKAIEPVYK